MAAAVIDPNSVGRVEIVADIDIRVAVAVEVAHLDSEAIVPWRALGFALFVEKKLRVPGNRPESSFAIVQIKHIRLAHFLQTPFNEFQAVGVATRHHPLSVDLLEVSLTAGTQDGQGA